MDGMVAATMNELQGATVGGGGRGGRKRPYLTPDAAKLRQAEKVPGTDLYVEVNLGAQTIARLCQRLLGKLNYSESDLVFEVRQIWEGWDGPRYYEHQIGLANIDQQSLSRNRAEILVGIAAGRQIFWVTGNSLPGDRWARHDGLD